MSVDVKEDKETEVKEEDRKIKDERSEPKEELSKEKDSSKVSNAQKPKTNQKLSAGFFGK